MKLATVFLSSALIVAASSVLMRVLLEPKASAAPTTSQSEQVSWLNEGAFTPPEA